MASLRQCSTRQSSYCLDLAARVECAQQSAPFHLCSAASFFSIGFLRGGLLRSGRGIWRCVEFQIIPPVLISQTPILSVCLGKHVPRSPLRACPAFLLTTSWIEWES